MKCNFITNAEIQKIMSIMIQTWLNMADISLIFFERNGKLFLNKILYFSNVQSEHKSVRGGRQYSELLSWKEWNGSNWFEKNLFQYMLLFISVNHEIGNTERTWCQI